MSLDYNLTNVRDYENLYEDAGDDMVRLNPLTEMLIFGTMIVDMGEITEKNWREFFVRFNAANQVMRVWVDIQSKKPTSVSADDIKRHIGLKTNVVTTSKAKFMDKLIKSVED